MQFYRVLWKKILLEIEQKNTNFKFDTNFLSAIFKEKNNLLLIYTKLSNIEYLKKFTNQIEKSFKEHSDKTITIFFKQCLSEINDELIKDHKHFLSKNENKKISLHSKNTFIFDFLLKSIVSEKKKESEVFLIWGNQGVGKTSLVTSLLYKLEKEKESINALYINIFDFSNNFYKFIEGKKKDDEFIYFFKKYKLLIFDDLHLIKNREKIIKIIHSITKKSVELNQNIIFISNDKKNIDKSLLEFIDQSYDFKINEPNKSDISIIIQDFINQHNNNLKITSEAINYLSSILGNNISVLINRLISILVFFENPNSMKIINLENIKKIQEKISFFKKTQDLINYSNNHQLKIICKKLNFNVSEITSKNRKKSVVFNRNIVIYVLKKKLNFSHEYIGKILNKDHSTISHSLQQIDLKLKEKDFRDYFEIFLEKIF